jgi:hypothetical protein
MLPARAACAIAGGIRADEKAAAAQPAIDRRPAVHALFVLSACSPGNIRTRIVAKKKLSTAMLTCDGTIYQRI